MYITAVYTQETYRKRRVLESVNHYAYDQSQYKNKTKLTYKNQIQIGTK